MNLKDALIRAARTVAQTAVGVLVGFPVMESIFDFKVIGSTYAAAAIIGIHAGVISFLQNVAEDNTALSVPK